MLTWVDLLALFALALSLALGVRLGLAFGLAALVGVGVYLLAPGGVFLALVLGFLLGLLLKTFPLPSLPRPLEALVGGLGGAALGLFLALALWTGFPAEWAPSTGALRYPSSRLPTPLYEALKESPFAPGLFGWVNGSPVLRRALLHLK
ncbi:hypothetical protein [Thermus filiformis]|uniref:CvpA family protein n=1 Tax=Thermus filiformis TaxID=276 RepID=A0A0A2XB34_THEFI|nr:hypothetical protein [Thermus filiformis]KGQ22394.2 hypothetical protein THFILI_11330 [Thermus filiformis]